ncbi:MAG: CpaF family protein [Acidimicrobiia bacterium]|nr:CpaF family protein [Acidimicrobiia bacterium]
MTVIVEPEASIRAAVHRRLVESDGAEALLRVPAPEVRRRIANLVASEHPLLAMDRREQLVGEVLNDVVGLGPLEPLLADATIDEIMINGGGRCFVERGGVLEPVDVPIGEVELLRLVDRILAPLSLRLDRSSPLVEARLADGSRLHAVIPPLAIDGPCVTIRRFGARPVPVEDFGVRPAGVELLRDVIVDGANVVISGGTGSGKTTLLNALAAAIDDRERIVTIEETAELRLGQPHVVRLEARPANAEGAGAVTVRELIRASLRMRPDRLVVGEVRGAEALDLVQALNTGHEGSLSTVHANSPLDALRRLSTLALFGGTGLPHDAICEQLRASVDVIVQVARSGSGARHIAAVVEVVEHADGFEVHPLLERHGQSVQVLGTRHRMPRRRIRR